MVHAVQSSNIGAGTGGLGKKGTSGDHPNYSIVQIDKNIKKTPGDLRRFVVSQTTVRKN